MPAVKETQLRYLEYIHREDAYRHHRYDEEMLQYHLLRDGNPAAVPESKRMWSSGLVGQVNDDAVKNRKYLFVASITLACPLTTAVVLSIETDTFFACAVPKVWN